VSRPRLPASYFDGTSARAHPVTLQLDGSVLRVSGEDIDRAVPLSDVSWPERTRHGMRLAHFSSGGSVQCADASAWDAWSRGSGRRDPLVVRLQQSWRGVLASLLVLAAMAVLLQQWGLPVAARAVVAATPLSVDAALGTATLAVMDEHLMRPSKLPLDAQARLRAALAQAVGALPAGSVPAWQLVFRQSRIGPNALALPGGTLVMTDELVELVGRNDRVITAVLAHELGHLRHRHGLRMLVQVTVLGGLASLVLGDFSTLLAGVPVLLGQASYSREAEREADAEAVRILRAAAISPDVMVTLFDKLDEKRRKAGKGQGDGAVPGQDSWLGIAFASHPPDADRVRFFREAAAGR
jgi:Zn-dependent protease with chaperone function